jgi:hypothetical protein
MDIRAEIKNQNTERIEFSASNGDTIPSADDFKNSMLLANADKRNKSFDGCLIFKNAAHRELKVVVWALDCDDDAIKFYGYCDYVWYGSGQVGNKAGFGFTLLEGLIRFDESGNGKSSMIYKMADKTFNR